LTSALRIPYEELMHRTGDAAASGQVGIGGDLRVHRLGFGAMRLTGRGVWGPPPDRAECLATLRRALDLGITLIDTADSYGPSISETLIAEALYPYPAGLVLATKGGFDRPGPDQWRIDCRPQRLREALEGSLRRLRLDRIDLYQLHRIDPEVREEDQFGFLREAQREGKIRHIGLSEVTVDQIVRARRYFPVVSVQNRYNLVDREWEAVVDFCDREQITFIPWAPLQAGAVAQRGVRQYLKRLVRRTRWHGAVTRIAARHHATPSQIALAWLLHRSRVIVPIPGTSRRRHLDENVAAAAIALTPDDVAALRDVATL
jgi:aryl-alcohol dehydrogenase-like predicted oxidoreductase